MIFADDGTILVHQSWMDTFLDCPERARRELLEPRTEEGDAASCGTAIHAGIEAVIRGEIADTVEAITAYAREHMQMLLDTTNVVFKSHDGPADVINLAGLCAAAWLRSIWPSLPKGGQAEVNFRTPPFATVNGYPLAFEGMADYVLPNKLWDWKSANRDYKQDKKQKSAIQPSIYTYAATTGALGFPGEGYPPTIPFTYGVMIRIQKPRVQQLTVYRHAGHWTWAQRRTIQAVQFALDYGLHREWPTNEESFLCSDKWCPFFDTCRGAHLSWRDDRLGR